MSPSMGNVRYPDFARDGAQSALARVGDANDPFLQLLGGVLLLHELFNDAKSQGGLGSHSGFGDDDHGDPFIFEAFEQIIKVVGA